MKGSSRRFRRDATQALKGLARMKDRLKRKKVWFWRGPNDSIEVDPRIFEWRKRAGWRWR